MLIFKMILIIADFVLAGMCVLGIEEYAETRDKVFALSVSVVLVISAIALFV